MKIEITKQGKGQYATMHLESDPVFNYEACKNRLKRKMKQHRSYVETGMPSLLSNEIEAEMVKDIARDLKYIHRHFVIKPESFNKEFIQL